LIGVSLAFGVTKPNDDLSDERFLSESSDHCWAHDTFGRDRLCVYYLLILSNSVGDAPRLLSGDGLRQIEEYSAITGASRE